MDNKIPGILNMGSWAFFQEKGVAYSRFLSCCCCYCKTGIKENMINKCLNVSTVGRLTPIDMIPKAQATVHTNSRPNNNSRPIGIPPANKRRRINEPPPLLTNK